MSSAGMLLALLGYPGSVYVQGMLGVGRIFRRDFWDKIPLSFLSLLLPFWEWQEDMCSALRPSGAALTHAQLAFDPSNTT